jgi:hypothetical protein
MATLKGLFRKFSHKSELKMYLDQIVPLHVFCFPKEYVERKQVLEPPGKSSSSDLSVVFCSLEAQRMVAINKLLRKNRYEEPITLLTAVRKYKTAFLSPLLQLSWSA